MLAANVSTDARSKLFIPHYAGAGKGAFIQSASDGAKAFPNLMPLGGSISGVSWWPAMLLPRVMCC